jgi:lantibiotic biosynthesis dehydratase-like protein
MDNSHWRSYHLFYYGDLDRAVTGFVQPALAALLREDYVDRFFFIRYALGGPHIRLRLRLRPEHAEVVSRFLTATAERFFARCPSTAEVPDETIRRINKTILLTDPAETDDSVYPNHSLQELPFRPEAERYGGADLLEHSLDFFQLSSIQALRFLGCSRENSRGQKLTIIFRLLVRQALGFARDTEHLLALFAYPAALWGGSLPGIAKRGDDAFERQRRALRSLLREEVDAFLSSSVSASFEPARQLAWEIRSAGEPARSRIETSQMHMTANRLGLTNQEEVYLSRLLMHAAQDLADVEPAFWSRLQEHFSQSSSPSQESGGLRELLPPMVAQAFPPAGTLMKAGRPREYEWVHFVTRHDSVGKLWVEEYMSRCGSAVEQIRYALALLRKRQVTAGCEILAAVEDWLGRLREIPSSFSHVMDRFYYGALAYYLYCINDLDGAYEAVEQAYESVKHALEWEPTLLPLALTCYEFPLHKARIEYQKGRWGKARQQIEVAAQTLMDLRPLCVLASGETIYFSRVAEYFQQILELDADENAFIRDVSDREVCLWNLDRTVAGIYATPIIPYP